jgi:DNA-binding IclR family transcriptional regulator
MVEQPKIYIDKILDLLSDGEEHPIGELFEKVNVPLQKLRFILDFLQTFDLVYQNTSKTTAKIGPVTQEFLKRLKLLED